MFQVLNKKNGSMLCNGEFKDCYRVMQLLKPEDRKGVVLKRIFEEKKLGLASKIVLTADEKYNLGL